MRAPLRRWHRRASIALACAGAGLLLFAATTPLVYAAGPQRVGWWNAASTSGTPVGSAAAPSPTTPAGGLRVASGPTTAAGPLLPSQVPPNPQILAYGAVLYALPEGESAILRLTIAGSPQGTPQVVACPTADTNWSAGDDQPSSSEPAYDCGPQHFTGTVSADGTAITFQVHALFEPTPGLLSLAIVPDTGSTALPTGGSPFAVDFAAPAADSLTPQQTDTAPSNDALPPPFLTPFSPGAPAGAGEPLGLPLASAPPPAPAPSAAPPAATRSAPAHPATARAALPADASMTLKAQVAATLGKVTLLAAIMVWGLGRGLLGGRIIPLSVPLKRE